MANGIIAQDLYDRRDMYEEISGTDLHDIFNALCGDPSPAGRTPIEERAIDDLADAYAKRFAAHKAAGGVGGQYLQDMVLFLWRVRQQLSSEGRTFAA